MKALLNIEVIVCGIDHFLEKSMMFLIFLAS